MFIYKGHIYRKVEGINCTLCPFLKRLGCDNSLCYGYHFVELFISRLSHAIIEVLFARKEHDK